MNFSGAGAGLVFGAVLEATVLGSILIVLVGVAQRVAGKRLGPSWRFALWGIVLVRLLVPIAPESRWSVFNAGQWFTEEKSAPVVRKQVEPALVFPAMAGEAVEVGFPAEVPAFASERDVQRPFPWGIFGMWVWGAGVVCLLGRFLLGTWWLRRKIRREAQHPGVEAKLSGAGDLNEAVEAAATEMRVRRRFRVAETGLVSSPALFGLWRPQLLVPRGFAEKLTAQELRYVLLHEFAHLKRWDLVTNWLMTVAQAVYWFNPLVWLALRQMRMERELACDEMVLRTSRSGANEGRAYGETILRLLEGVKPRRSLPALVGIAEEKHSAKRRMLQIVGFDAKRPRRRALGVLLLVVIGIGGLTNAQTERPEMVDPSETTTAQTSLEDNTKPEEAANHSKLVNDARLLLEMGRLDEAEGKLQEVLTRDPEHRAGVYFSRLIEERRMALEEQKRNVPVQPELRLLPFGQRQAEIIPLADRPPNPYARTNRISSTSVEASELDARETELLEALKTNPNDSSAVNLLVELRNKRYAAEAGKREAGSRKNPSGGRAELVKKLNELVVEYYELPNGVPLHEVIKDIHRLARKLDPEKVGVNFVVSGQLNSPAGEESGTGFEPFSGRPKMPLKVTDYVVQLNPPLRKVTMLGLINAIVEVAEPPKEHAGAPPLRYSVEDYAIVFAQKTREPEALYTRTFKIDPNSFLEGMRPVIDVNQALQGNAGDRGPRMQQVVRDFFTAAGVNFGAGGLDYFSPQLAVATPPQKAIFYNDRTGVLMVRATLGDLELIEKALQTMIDAVPEQVMISVDVMEVKGREEFEMLFNREGSHTVLTTLGFRTMEKNALNAGFEWLKLPRVTTLSGRPARITQEKIVSVDVTCEYRKKDKTFIVRASSNDPKNGKTEAQEAVVFDGQTMVLLPKVEGGSVTPARVVFITPLLIDPAGNAVNNGDDDFVRSIELEVPEK